MDYTWLQLVVWCLLLPEIQGALYSNLWAVHIKGGERVARSVAEDCGFNYIDPIMDDYYHFQHHEVMRRSVEANTHHHEKLENHSQVKWVAQQVIKSRKKRDLLTFNDEKYRQQWYLHGSSQSKRSSARSMNVQGAWTKGYSGKGVVVTVLDDGIETNHPDLSENYDPKASYDVNGNDKDPFPRYDFTNENRHGTRCAGEIAAVANNQVCGVGVAYSASIGGIRMLDGDITDSVEAKSLSLERNHIDIYSASWGPDDDGKTVDGPATLARKAFRDGVAQGRNGRGSIFVWASGNGGNYHDNCNCDGYTNSIYTFTVSSATEKGNVPWYSEACSSTLVSTFSSGDHEERQITTTDLKRGCTNLHTGTSASAPLAAGIVALTLGANPNLTWRDVQYIAVLSASPVGLEAEDWVTNGAGRRTSHHFGFGMMNAGKMVDLALNWTNIPEQHICEVASPDKNILIMPSKSQKLHLTTAGCQNSNKEVRYVEHVQAKITLSSYWRGDLQIWLTSPSGTRSTLLTSRVHDDSRMGFNEWGFLTTHNWGEQSRGKWTLEIANGYRAGKHARLISWSLVLYGTATNPIKMKPAPIRRPQSKPETTRAPLFGPTVDDSELLPPTAAAAPALPTVAAPVGPKAKLKSEAVVAKTIVDDVINHIPEVNTEPTDDVFDGFNRAQSTISNTIGNYLNIGVWCADGLYNMRDKCVDKCPTGYHPDRLPKRYRVCMACHYTCAACTGAHNYSCSECYFGSMLYKGQCVSKADHIPFQTRASKQKNGGNLSPIQLKSLVYGGISTVAVLLAVLACLLIYYKYHQYKVRLHKTVTHAITIYKPGTCTAARPDSQHSSQQELMDTDSELSTQSQHSRTSVEYRYITHAHGTPVHPIHPV